MFDFGPKNFLNESVVSSYSLYGSDDNYIFSLLEKIIVPGKEDNKFPERIGYYINNDLDILAVKVGHGWSGYEHRQIFFEKDNKFFGRWDYEEYSTTMNNIFVSKEDAKFVLNNYLDEKIIEKRKKLNILSIKIKKIGRDNFYFSIDDDCDDITISNNHGGSCIDDPTNDILQKFFKKKFSSYIERKQEELDELNEIKKKINS